MDSTQFWDVIKLSIVAVITFVLYKIDNDHREAQRQSAALFKDLFSRVRKVEIKCASEHGLHHHQREDDED